MRSGPISGWEDLTRDNEGCGIGSKVLEEVAEDVDGELALGADLVVTESKDTEEDGQHGETHKLNWLSADRIDGGNREPVTRNETSARKDNITDTLVVDGIVHIFVGWSSVTDSRKDDGSVETETVERNIEKEPRSGCSNEHFGISPFRVVVEEVAPGSLWRSTWISDLLVAHGSSLLINSKLSSTQTAGNVLNGILGGGGLISLNIECVSDSLRNGQSEIQGKASWNSTESVDDSPRLVESDLTSVVTSSLARQDFILEPDCADKSHDTGSKLTPALVSEDGSHHGASPLNSRKFGCDDS